MTSTYGYTTVAALELYTSKDYSTYSSSYSDNAIEAWITQAEKLVNSLVYDSFTGTIPDYIVSATMLIASRIARNRMIDDGFIMQSSLSNERKLPLVPLIDDDVKAILGLPVQTLFFAQGKQAGAC